MNSTNCAQTGTTIGQGCDFFDLKISVEKLHSISHLTSGIEQNAPCWISYRFLGHVHQSDTFDMSCEFPQMTKTFRIRSSLCELAEHFGDKKNAVLRVHVCTSGQVLGTAVVNLLPLFCVQGNVEFEGRMSRGEYVVCAANKQRQNDPNSLESACLVALICLDKEPQCRNIVGQHTNQPRVCSSISSQTDLAEESHVKIGDCTSSPTGTAKGDRQEVNENKNVNATFLQQKLLDERERELKARDAQVCIKEKEIYHSISSLETKRCEWEQWRHEEELRWHEKLKGKEAATMRTIEDRMCQIEKHRIKSLEASRSEYEKLEGRLRNALIEVEAKERQLKEVEVTHQNERKRKMAELELREKAMKHSIEIEQAKAKAALDQVAEAQKSLAAAGKKIRLLEDEIDEIRAKHRQTPEVTLIQQLAEVKGQLADSERRIEMVKAEKAEILLEKEQFRASVNKLAKALRNEREKTVAKDRQQKQVRLSYDANDNSFVVGGRQDEVQRILSDLSNLSQLQDPARTSLTSPTRVTNLNQQQRNGDTGSMPISDPPPPPLPSPQPSRPSCLSPTPSWMSLPSNSGNIDFDKLISTPS